MPIPTTSMGGCMRMLRKEHPDWAQDKKIAVCLDAMRKAGKNVPKKK